MNIIEEMQRIYEKEKRGIFVVNILGIIHDPKNGKILIGRRENDSYIKELSWCFPGGMPCYEEELTNCLKREIQVKTHLLVKIEDLIFTKTYPEKRHFLSIYYYCTIPEYVKELEAEAGEKFVEVKWVKPTEVVNYFTTSLHAKVLDFLKKLEENYKEKRLQEPDEKIGPYDCYD